MGYIELDTFSYSGLQETQSISKPGLCGQGPSNFTKLPVRPEKHVICDSYAPCNYTLTTISRSIIPQGGDSGSEQYDI